MNLKKYNCCIALQSSLEFVILEDFLFNAYKELSQIQYLLAAHKLSEPIQNYLTTWILPACLQLALPGVAWLTCRMFSWK